MFLYAGEALCEAWNPVCIGKIDGVIGKIKVLPGIGVPFILWFLF